MSYPGDIYVPYNLKTIAKKCLKLLGKCCKKILPPPETINFDFEELHQGGRYDTGAGRQHRVLPRILVLNEADLSWTPVHFFLACVFKNNNSLILSFLLCKMVAVTSS